MDHVAPGSSQELEQLILASASSGRKLELRGGGTKASVGRPREGATIVELSGLAGITAFEPAELVLTAGAGTPLREVLALLAEHGQMLAFEPYECGDPGFATIGGAVSAAIAGPSRLSRGGARDHLLGFTAISGRGETFKAGGKVVKNVTGYDLPKLAAGSWGRLWALTEVTLKVVPAPRVSATLTIAGLSTEAACAAMSRALGSQADVAAAAYFPHGANDGRRSLTAFRLEGFAPSVDARCRLLGSIFADLNPLEFPADLAATQIWGELTARATLARARQLWRLVIVAKNMPRVADKLDQLGCEWLADWGGGLIWADHDGDPGQVRAAVEGHGHATFWRGSGDFLDVPVFQPLPEPLAQLEQRLRRAFDPAGVFETSRFGD